MKRAIWSKEEIDLLKDLYENKGLSYHDISLIFKTLNFNRTPESIHIKITRSKFRHNSSQTLNIKSKNVSGEKNPMFGKDSVNKGLTKENSERIRLASEKISKTRSKMFLDGLLSGMSGDKNPRYGKLPWSSGLTKHNDIRLLNVSKKSSDNAKRIWAQKSDDEKIKVIERLNQVMINQHKPTKIEIKVANYLKSKNIKYLSNHKINNFYVDFYLIDYNIVIECDGDFWHSNPLFYKNKVLTKVQKKNIDRDLRKNNMLESNNIQYLRFWENDIHKNFLDVTNKIDSILK